MQQNFSDPEFLARLKKKDRQAITTLVTQYNRQLFNAALGQGVNADSAEEVVQSTWAAFFEAIDRFEGRSHIRTYIFGILYNKIREIWRYNKRFVDAEDSNNIDAIIDNQFNSDGLWGPEFSGYEPVEPERFMEASESLDIIEECMGGLKKNHRMVFYLKEVEGEDSESICNILGISRTNLGVLLYRAKQLLRKCIEGKAA